MEKIKIIGICILIILFLTFVVIATIRVKAEMDSNIEKARIFCEEEMNGSFDLYNSNPITGGANCVIDNYAYDIYYSNGGLYLK